MISKTTINILSNQLFELSKLHWFDFENIREMAVSAIVAHGLRIHEDSSSYLGFLNDNNVSLDEIKTWCENNLVKR